MATLHPAHPRFAPADARALALTAAGLLAWWLTYRALPGFGAWAAGLLPLPEGSATREAIGFFLYDTPKVLLLLGLVVFLMTVLRSFFPAERTRALLARHRAGGHLAAAGLGVVTPFCSCSAVSMFVGFVSAGVPLGVTFTFLIAAPMVNEIALGLLLALFGWQVALAYLGFGLLIAVGAGWLLGRLNLEGWLEPWVRDLRAQPTGFVTERPSWAARIAGGVEGVREILGRVWPWLVAGIAAGALIHGYAPEAALARVMGADSWWSVPAAVLLGVPMYSNAAGIMPVVEALLGKGAALGTVLAFMMSVIALSLPEMIILRKVLSARLIAVFVAIVASGILAVGLLFNALFG